MASIEKMSGRARTFFRKIGRIGLVVFGFMLVFFTANSRHLGGASDTTLGVDTAHADATNCTGCTSTSCAGGCGSGGCSGDSGCDSGDGGCGCGASG